MIFDCHTHRFSAVGPAQRAEDDRWLRDLDAAGVTRCVVLPYAGLCDARLIRAENEAIAEFCTSRPRGLVPFFTVNLHDAPAARAEFIRCAEQSGFRGVKVHSWLQAASLNGPTVDVVCEMAGHYGLPMLFHDGTPCFALPSQIAMLAKRHPRTQFILGHCGLLEYGRECIDAMNAVDNLWGCLCGPHLAGVAEILRRCDRDRLVWGSDYGFASACAIAYRLELLQHAADDDRLFESIVATNPSRLLPVRKDEAMAAPAEAVVTEEESTRRSPAHPPMWLRGDVHARTASEPDPVGKNDDP